jgi:hypothetical protein
MIGCDSKKVDIQRISLFPSVINDELATNFPREIPGG